MIWRYVMRDNYRYTKRKDDCIELKIKIPLSALERVIQDGYY
jgi:hypothetical protein